MAMESHWKMVWIRSRDRSVILGGLAIVPFGKRVYPNIDQKQKWCEGWGATVKKINCYLIVPHQLGKRPNQSKNFQGNLFWVWNGFRKMFLAGFCW